jgi:hypothetical protein
MLLSFSFSCHRWSSKENIEKCRDGFMLKDLSTVGPHRGRFLASKPKSGKSLPSTFDR